MLQVPIKKKSNKKILIRKNNHIHISNFLSYCFNKCLLYLKLIYKPHNFETVFNLV